MLRAQLALITQSASVDFSAVGIISAAVQKQIARDLTRYWPVQATIDAFQRLGDQPPDYWPIIIRDDIGYPGAKGVHWSDDNQPFALVQSSFVRDHVSLAVSHEALEMIVDPSGNRVIVGDALSPGQGRVNYLVEICDPDQGLDHAYKVNDVYVSDFVTPAYFDPVGQPGVAYSFCGHIRGPREVLEGGYISWIDPPTRHLWKAYRDSGTLHRRDAGLYDPSQPIRFHTDRHFFVADDSIDLIRWSGRGHRSRASRSDECKSPADRMDDQIQRIIRHARRTTKSARSTAGDS